MEDKTVCAYCGKKFNSVKARSSHQNNCPVYKQIRAEQEAEWKKTKHYCSICGKEITKFKRYGNALETCDNKECIKQALSKQRSEKAKREWQSQEYRDKIKTTSQEKYGTDSPLQSEVVKDKVKATNLKRYGVESLGIGHNI